MRWKRECVKWYGWIVVDPTFQNEITAAMIRLKIVDIDIFMLAAFDSANCKALW